MSEDKWQPQPIEVWKEVSENMDKIIVRDIVRSWQYERDMVKHDVFDPLAAELAALKAELAAKSECMEGALSDCHELIKQNAALKALVRVMVPHLKYLIGIPDMDTVSWAPGKKTKKSIQKTLDSPIVKAIREAPA